jgi:hypothetical protein
LYISSATEYGSFKIHLNSRIRRSVELGFQLSEAKSLGKELEVILIEYPVLLKLTVIMMPKKLVVTFPIACEKNI